MSCCRRGNLVGRGVMTARDRPRIVCLSFADDLRITLLFSILGTRGADTCLENAPVASCKTSSKEDRVRKRRAWLRWGIRRAATDATLRWAVPVAAGDLEPGGDGKARWPWVRPGLPWLLSVSVKMLRSRQVGSPRYDMPSPPAEE
ncbi:uncharacterized protein UV8b_03581 [Ustilaginoidea virens]|uniref:Uncharacterized protein n=1 Tax=Ustilaginoidea virens TaxID=1159556 RepID=A0A063C1U1_USTVR|nr:uncharacterized protein UV8b_03581 [Ustilaginoidea virens]QUC19340.1 hypothetical protein UV8b_03581 [Ustilaginoidea virens]GAO13176.1 hypothetical protein UVI_02025310 [Ustilaginoidea virens]